MPTPHNEAPAGAFAKTVLMPGDPLRAEFIAQTYLEGAKLVNNVRGVRGYTGTYRGVPVSVMASGMGMPSMGIYSYELYHFYGVENILRVGSAGAVSKRLRLRDVVLGQGACTDSAYARQFGLGEYTGIELPEEKGQMAGPEAAEEAGYTWYGGEVLSAAIGQSLSLFTPIQLANYVVALVNGGSHYRAHLLKEVKSSDYSRVVYDYQPELLHSIDIAPGDLKAVLQGMYDLSKTASMARYFDGLPVEVGCKTGTAEVGAGRTATATFTCFAPYDDPEVVIYLVAENGSSGGSLAQVAAGILAQYFSGGDSQSAPARENTLIR